MSIDDKFQLIHGLKVSLNIVGFHVTNQNGKDITNILNITCIRRHQTKKKSYSKKSIFI